MFQNTFYEVHPEKIKAQKISNQCIFKKKLKPLQKGRCN